jgi:Na+-driven multidrug efflux pump
MSAGKVTVGGIILMAIGGATGSAGAGGLGFAVTVFAFLFLMIDAIAQGITSMFGKESGSPKD